MSTARQGLSDAVACPQCGMAMDRGFIASQEGSRPVGAIVWTTSPSRGIDPLPDDGVRPEWLTHFPHRDPIPALRCETCQVGFFNYSPV